MTRGGGGGISVRVCEGIFTLILLPGGREGRREEGKGGEPQVFILPLQGWEPYHLASHARFVAAVVLLSHDVTFSLLFRRVSFLPKAISEKQSIEKERGGRSGDTHAKNQSVDAFADISVAVISALPRSEKR